LRRTTSLTCDRSCVMLLSLAFCQSSGRVYVQSHNKVSLVKTLTIIVINYKNTSDEDGNNTNSHSTVDNILDTK